AEQRALPAAEAVIGDRHGQRNVDANHAHLDLLAEKPRRLAIAGEDAGAVAVLMGVDQLDGRLQAADAHDAQHRPEDLLPVDAHVRRDLIEQAAAEEEAIRTARNTQPATIHHQLRPGTHAIGDVAA